MGYLVKGKKMEQEAVPLNFINQMWLHRETGFLGGVELAENKLGMYLNKSSSQSLGLAIQNVLYYCQSPQLFGLIE